MMIDVASLSTSGAWRLSVVEDGGERPGGSVAGRIARLVFDLPGEKVNKLTSAVLEDLDRILAALAAEPLAALIVEGGKAASGTFIAGADIHEIRAITDAGEAASKAARGQAILGRLASLPAVTVAAIHGNCLGGGTELALACDLRVASDSPRTRIGLPEVNLGILPGFGGTQRLPRLVGLARALPVILSGRPLDARQAERIGLVDRLAYPPLLVTEALRLAREAAAGGGKRFRPRRPRPSLLGRFLERLPPGRALIRARARKGILRQAGPHYPAPLAALDTAVDGLSLRLDDGLALEARRVGELAAGAIAKNLIDVFLGMEAAKRPRKAAESRDKPGRGADACSVPSRRVGIVGAGVMGGGIAALLAEKGFRARLRDVQPAAIQAALAKVRDLLGERVRRRRMSRREMENAFAAITATTSSRGFGGVEAVIETVVEDMEVKKTVVREIEALIPEGALLASNTSALSITELQSAARRPERVLGLHFFNPVDRMLLVEVVEGERTSHEALERGEDLARALGKVPVRVKDGPGFLVNRLLAPYLSGAARLFAEGFEPARVDAALRGFGMPMGPFELLDEVGLDVAGKVAKLLHGALGERISGPGALEDLVRSGILGKKSGKGFYVHGKKRRTPNPEALRLGGTGGRRFKAGEPAVWVERLILPVINEAAFVLEEGIVRSPAVLDLAMVLGTGFAPFRGGPLRHADSVGLLAVSGGLERHGTQPAPLLERLAADGSRFHDLVETELAGAGLAHGATRNAP